MKEAPESPTKMEYFEDNSLRPKGELGQYEFRYGEIIEFPFERGVLLYSQSENGLGIKRGLVIGWKKGEPITKGDNMTRKIQSLSKEERERVKAGLKDVLEGPIDFW
ncbi:MAG: hypothetical protein HY445_03145 [Candidatus Niyogibacteria bacterium]|nr:hypothetical protein [Candidatus Niyogibacteria bacterium]